MTAPTALLLSCDEVRDQLPAYALGALDPDERLAVERHLATCAGCRAALESFEGVATAMASAAPPVPPPASLRVRLMTEVQSPRALESDAKAATASTAPRKGFFVPRWAAAA